MNPLTNPSVGQLTAENISLQQEKKAEKMDHLRHAADEFEQVMVSRIFKEGMKAAEELRDDPDESSTSRSWRSLANEQLANHAGKFVKLGVADSIVASLQDQI